MSDPHSNHGSELLRRARRHRLIRRIHLWVGAWGAVAAIVFGFTGIVQDHRQWLALPQGDSSELAKVELPVPESARATPDALRAWLRDDQHIAIDSQRVQPGRPFVFDGRKVRPPARWMFNGGSARTSIQAEYSQGNASLVLRTMHQSPLAMLLRLHKGVGIGNAWILLADSFALAMMALGISGLLMWARGRNLRQMVFSTVGAAVAAMVVGAGLHIG